MARDQRIYIPTENFKLPQASIARLRANNRPATSDLSTSELLLVRAAGFKPLGFVMGVSCFHVPSYVYNYTDSFEITDLSQAMYGMREAAMLRMEAEADVLGADGVVGVRFSITQTDIGYEFYSFGTAVKAGPKRAERRQWRNNRNMPFLSDLSGQAFWTCLKAGYAPVGFVLGCCVYHMGYRSVRQTWRQRNSIVEIDLYTQAEYTARELAMGRMEAQAQELGADMVLEFDLKHHGWGWGHTLEFIASGTAVQQFEDDPELDPALVLSLTQ